VGLGSDSVFEHFSNKECQTVPLISQDI
jgi:hypothetical protein